MQQQAVEKLLVSCLETPWRNYIQNVADKLQVLKPISTHSHSDDTGLKTSSCLQCIIKATSYIVNDHRLLDQHLNMDAQRMHVWRWHSVRFCVGVTYSCHYKQPHTALTAFDSDKPSCRPDAQPLKSLAGWVTQVKEFSNVQLGTTQPTAASLKTLSS